MEKTYNHEDALEKAREEIALKNGEEVAVEIDNNSLVRKVTLQDGQVITFDFGKLTGNSIVDIKKKYTKLRKRNASMIEEFDDFYYMLVAEYTSGTHYEKFLKLAYRDFAKVRNVVRDFLGEED